MKHNFLFSILLLFIFAAPHILQAQGRYEDVVYLKNGSIIRGMIMEQVPNESIKIQTRDRNVLFYKMDEIEKMTKEEVPVNWKKRRELTPDDYNSRGYFNIVEGTFASALRGRDFEDQADDNGELSTGFSAGIQMVNGYQFNPYLNLGLGFGVNAYSEMLLLPVFLDVRVNLLAGRVSPFVAGTIGHSSNFKKIVGQRVWGNDTDGGLTYNPAIGVKFYTRPGKLLYFSLGYRFQEYNYEYDGYSNYGSNYTEMRTTNLGWFNFKFGFSFFSARPISGKTK